MSFQGQGKTLGGASSSSSSSSPSSSSHYRDPLWAGLFLAQLVTVLGVAVLIGYPALQKQKNETELSSSTYSSNINSDDETTPLTWTALTWTLGVSLSAALGASVMVLGILYQFAAWIVPLAFCAAPITAIVLATTATLSLGFHPAFWYSAASVTAGTAAVYYFVCRKYVPFAASTLRVALTALHAHAGLLGLAVLDSLLVALWTLAWAVSAFGMYQLYQQREAPVLRQEPCPDNPNRMCQVQDKDFLPAIVVAGMMLSFFWTIQVLQNILHTTTAGTLACWWVQQEQERQQRPGASNTDRSKDMRDALVRACTLSFGSICFGSLIVAVVQTLERVVANAASKKRQENSRRNDRRQTNRDNGGNARAQWLLQWLKKITEYVNSWAFVYVGVYGYTYLQAGKTVSSLVAQRGWSSFVSDRLIYRVLGLAKASIAVLAGALAVLLTAELSWLVFGVGVAAGFVVSNTTLFVVESAVRTVIVCFAEKPQELATCHAAEYRALQHGWSTAYPEAWAGQHHRRG